MSGNSRYQANSARNALLPWYIAHGLGVFIASLTTAAVYFFSAYELHQSVQMRLGMAAGAGLVYCMAALLGGRLVDRFGQRRVAIAAALACLPVFLFGAAAVLFRDFAAMFAFLLMLNVCVGPLWPAIESAITRSPGTMRPSLRITLYNLNWSTTGFIAACLVGTLARYLSWTAVFLLAAAGSAVVWLIFLTMPERTSLTAAGSAAGVSGALGDHDRQIVHSPRARKLLHAAWLSNMLAFIAANTVAPCMPTITLALGIKSYALATALASIASLACIGGFLVTAVWTGWHYRIRWTMIPFGMLIIGAVGILMSQSVMMFVVTQIMYGAAVAMLYSGSIYYSMHLGAGSATKAGIHEAWVGVGAALGPGMVAVAGAPGAIVPKAVALFAVLCTGAGVLIGMAWQARR